MNNVDPHAWLTQTLERIARGWPISRLTCPGASNLNGFSFALTYFLGVTKRELRRRSAIEPVIDHMWTRSNLKGREADTAHVVIT
jgi:hypothetical protein